jgi:hypothetical protein
MLIVAFAAFLVLVVAWLIAPNGDTKVEVVAPPSPAAPVLKTGEAAA